MNLSNNLEGALSWYRFGLNVVPLVPESKTTAVKWNEWLDNLSEDSIRAHWKKHPDHEVGHLCDERVYVLDADTPESAARLHEIEKAFDVKPAMIIGTTNGLHHCFGRAEGTIAQMDSHNSEKFPEGIDVRTGKGDRKGMSMAVLPPSKGKYVVLLEAESMAELTVAQQDFIDAICRNNGRKVPTEQSKPKCKTDRPEPTDEDAQFAQGLLDHIDAGLGYQDWFKCLSAIKHTLGDTDEAFDIANVWSSAASNYCGPDKLRNQWDAIAIDVEHPVTVGTLVMMARDNGADIDAIRSSVGPQFVREIGTTVVLPESDQCKPEKDTTLVSVDSSDPKCTVPDDRLARYSLTGKSAEYEQQLAEQKFVLAGIALIGQWTVQYAGPNTGKTLLTLHQLGDAIQRGDINAGNAFYIDADDNYVGLTEKLKIAERHGFHILAPGHQGFDTKDLLPTLYDMAMSSNVHDTVVVLDTLKKFTDIMDKKALRRFGEIIRMFISKGGTLIALAHVNKNPDENGMPIYSGTTDILDDADCVYVLHTLQDLEDKRVVEYRNIKNRGNVMQRKVFSYAVGEGLDYAMLLASVEALDDDEAEKYRTTGKPSSEKVVSTDIVVECIEAGYTTKMKLIQEVAARAKVSRNVARETIERFTGDDPEAHYWNFEVGERGAKKFKLLQKPENLNSCEPAD